jgi:hypothetical protein
LFDILVIEYWKLFRVYFIYWTLKIEVYPPRIDNRVETGLEIASPRLHAMATCHGSAYGGEFVYWDLFGNWDLVIGHSTIGGSTIESEQKLYLPLPS